jgi:HTH-type transcriptional regulator/antitoxin HigA
LWRNNKAILALSVRGKRADIFWFTFFHEIAHLLNHSHREFHINYDKRCEEDEADKIAGNYLISAEQYKKFIENYNYEEKIQIINYSKEIGIASYILVGRLQHDKLIGYHHNNDLIPHFQIARS